MAGSNNPNFFKSRHVGLRLFILFLASQKNVSGLNEHFKSTAIKNLHLLISVIFIIPIALTYGLYPDVILLRLFDINVDTINLKNIFRAVMGLYLRVVCNLDYWHDQA